MPTIMMALEILQRKKKNKSPNLREFTAYLGKVDKGLVSDKACTVCSGDKGFQEDNSGAGGTRKVREEKSQQQLLLWPSGDCPKQCKRSS